MQLTRSHGLVLLVGLAAPFLARADTDFELDSTTTLFHEAGGPLEMTVLTPSADAKLHIDDAVRVRGSWEADVVTGASVAVVDAPSTGVDVISSATKLTDTRHTVGGGITLLGETTELEVSYVWGTESDYRTMGFQLRGRAELYERNTTLEIGYSRGFDKACNLRQESAQQAVDRQRMPSSEGCFGGSARESLDLAVHTFQGSWTQAWAPILATQLTLTAQVLHGYQGNPYRSVWLGVTAAQEHHPEDRARYAAGLGVRLWLAPLSGALKASSRLYRDSWDVESITGELGYEQDIAAGVQLRVRARHYRQTGAFFYSDDYVRFPRGAYFTGDRELSPMSSWTVGGRLHYTAKTGDDGKVGFLDAFELVLKGDFVKYTLDEFHYGSARIPNDKAVIATLGLEAVF